MNRNNLSVLLPYRRLEFHTSLTTDQAAQLVGEQIIPRKTLRFFGPSRDEAGRFEGVVTPDGFKISRVIRYRNSFLPVLHGKFTPESGGTVINVSMRMYPAVIIFIVVFLAIWIGVTGTIFSTAQIRAYNFLYAEPIVMIGFFYVIIIASFAYEANKAQIFLRDLFGKYEFPASLLEM